MLRATGPRVLDIAEDCKNITNYNKNIAYVLEWINVSDFMVIDTCKNVTTCKGIRNRLEFWIPRRRFRISTGLDPGLDPALCQRNLNSGIQSLVSWAQERMSCIRDCKAQDFGFQKQKFFGFRQESGFPYIGRKIDWECRHLRASCHTMSSGYHPLTRNQRPSANETAITFQSDLRKNTFKNYYM